MTNEILDMMEERRLLNIIKVYIEKKMLKFRENVTKQKKTMLLQQSDLIEQLDATNQCNLMHAQIRKTIGAHKGNATTTCIEGKDGNIIMDQDKKRTSCHVSSIGRALTFRADALGSIPGPA